MCCMCPSWLQNHWYDDVLKKWNITHKFVDDCNNFHGDFKGTGCLNWCAKEKHFVVCGQLFQSSTTYFISAEHKICVLSIRFEKPDAFHKDYIWLDTEKDFSFCTYTCVNIELATCHFQLRLVAVWCMWEWWQHGQGRKGRYVWLWTSPWVLPKPMLVMKLVNHSFMCTGLVGIMVLEIWCFCIRFSTEQLSITDFFRKKEVIFTQILT